MKRFQVGDLAKVSPEAVYDVYDLYKINNSWKFLANKVVLITGTINTNGCHLEYSKIDGNIRYKFFSTIESLAIPDCFLEKII